MNRKLAWFVFAAALAAAPAGLLRAQDGPGGEMDEMEADGGPGQQGPGVMGAPEMTGPGGPGLRQGPMGQRRGMWIDEEETEDEGGRRQVTVKVRKMKGPGGMGMGPGGPGMGMGRGMLSEEEVMNLIKKYDAAFGKKVDELKIAAAAKYRMVMNMANRALAGAKMAEDPALEKDAVRGLSLEFETKELSRKYGKAPDGEKAAVKTELKAKLAELFDLKTKGQELRIRKMEKEMGKLKENLEKRKANKAKIVEQRVEQLTGEGFGW